MRTKHGRFAHSGRFNGDKPSSDIKYGKKPILRTTYRSVSANSQCTSALGSIKMSPENGRFWIVSILAFKEIPPLIFTRSVRRNRGRRSRTHQRNSRRWNMNRNIQENAQQKHIKPKKNKSEARWLGQLVYYTCLIILLFWNLKNNCLPPTEKLPHSMFMAWIHLTNRFQPKKRKQDALRVFPFYRAHVGGYSLSRKRNFW